jgi:hypothetical protein
MKYPAKFTNGIKRVNGKASGVAWFEPRALDTIFCAFKGTRTFQTSNHLTVETKLPKVNDIDIENKEQYENTSWKWNAKKLNWQIEFKDGKFVNLYESLSSYQSYLKAKGILYNGSLDIHTLGNWELTKKSVYYNILIGKNKPPS